MLKTHIELEYFYINLAFREGYIFANAHVNSTRKGLLGNFQRESKRGNMIRYLFETFSARNFDPVKLRINCDRFFLNRQTCNEKLTYVCICGAPFGNQGHRHSCHRYTWTIRYKPAHKPLKKNKLSD